MGTLNDSLSLWERARVRVKEFITEMAILRLSEKP